MSVPIIYQKQLGMLRHPFDANQGVYAPVFQWCADHKPVLKDADAEALRAIEDATKAMFAVVLDCQERLEDLFPGKTDAAPAPDADDATLRVVEPQ